MSRIVASRFLCLDSSTIAKLTKACSESGVCATRSEIESRGWIPVISLSHLQEMGQIENRDVFEARLRYLKGFRLLATIKTADLRPGFGDFLDIDATEIRNFLESPSASPADIVERVRQDLFTVWESRELLAAPPRVLSEFMAEVVPIRDKSQETASVLRADPIPGIKEMTLEEFAKSQLETASRGKIERTSAMMASQLGEYGDKRLNDTDKVASNFYSDVMEIMSSVDGDSPPTTAEEFIARVRKLFKIPESRINRKMKIDDLGALVQFSLTLRIYGRKLKRSISLTDVGPENLPSWSLRGALRDIQNKADRVSGSDYCDCSLAALGLYTSACEVDKRTFEYLNQIRKKGQTLCPETEKVFRVKDINNLVDVLPQ